MSLANRNVKLEGFEEFARNMDRLTKDMIEKLVDGVTDITEDLASKSQKLSPKLEGTLEESAAVKIEKSSRDITGTVSYNSPYALRRHEEPYKPGARKEYDSSGRPVGYIIDGRGPITRGKPSVDGMEPGRKYLERPFKKYVKKYENHLADKVGEVIK